MFGGGSVAAPRVVRESHEAWAAESPEIVAAFAAAADKLGDPGEPCGDAEDVRDYLTAWGETLAAAAAAGRGLFVTVG